MKAETFNSLYAQLKKMRLSGMAQELQNQYSQAGIDKISADQRIENLIEAESETRKSSKIRRLIKSAGFRYPMAAIDTETAVRQGADAEILEKLLAYSWIDSGANVLITGPTGSGKSYFACALGIGAASQGKTVKYERSGSFLRRLLHAEDENLLSEMIDRYAKYDLLILDDFGLMNLDINTCRNLFELLDSRDGRGSTIIVSQYPVSSWYGLFAENTFADACLDRLVKTAYRLLFDGESLRKVPE